MLFRSGLPWLYTWGSGRFSGVARDALHLAEQIEARLVGQPEAVGQAGCTASAAVAC